MRSGLVILHHGESEHLLDAVVVGKEHDQTVNAHSPATSRGQTVLKGSTEVLVNKLSLVITLILLVGLLLKALSLSVRVVQLGISIFGVLVL